MALPSDVDQDDGELRALTELLQSEGWKAYRALTDQEWGPEPTLNKLEAATKLFQRGETDAVHDTVQQIQASRREVLKVLELPAARIRALTPKKKAGPFEQLRRTHR